MALRGLGYQIDTSNDRLPLVVHGTGPRAGPHPGQRRAELAVRLGAAAGGGRRRLAGGGARAEPGRAAVHRDDPGADAGIPGQPAGGDADFDIEPDASSGSYFWGAGWLLGRGAATAGSEVTVRGWPTSGWQIDAEFPRYLPLPPELSRERHLGDSIMTAIVLAPFADQPDPVRRSGAAAGAGVRAGRGAADGAGQVRGAGGGDGGHTGGAPGAAARGGDRHLRRPPHGHVLRHAGAGGAGDPRAGSGVRGARRSRTSSRSWRRRRRKGWGRWFGRSGKLRRSQVRASWPEGGRWSTAQVLPGQCSVGGAGRGWRSEGFPSGSGPREPLPRSHDARSSPVGRVRLVCSRGPSEGALACFLCVRLI